MTEQTDPALHDARLAGYLRLAGRAPSAHNTQPWSPRVVDGGIEVAVVPGRTLPAGDPTFRDLLLSLGAWVECVAVAAAQDGLALAVEPLPALSCLDELPVHGDADPDHPVLRLALAPFAAGAPGASAQGPTTAHVRDRRVYRGTLRPAPDVWAGSPPLPAWLRLLEVDAPAMRHLVRLGAAWTASRPAVSAELVRWLRLSPTHPRYRLDGMTEAMLALPAPLARVAAAATRRPRVLAVVLAVAGALARTVEGLGRDTPLPARPREVPEPRVRHLVLVADPTVFAAGRRRGAHPAESRSGVTEDAAVDAGRALQRLWLHAHAHGVVVAPHSEVIDSPIAHGALRRRLGLRRSEVALSVFSAGLPSGPVPRSPRLDD